MKNEKILAEFKHRSEVLWKASKNPTTKTDLLIEYRAKAIAYDEVIDYLEGIWA